jgi:hypothetical protein
MDYMDAKVIEGRGHEDVLGRGVSVRRWIQLGLAIWIFSTVLLIVAVQCLRLENRTLRSRSQAAIQDKEKI